MAHEHGPDCDHDHGHDHGHEHGHLRLVREVEHDFQKSQKAAKNTFSRHKSLEQLQRRTVAAYEEMVSKLFKEMLRYVSKEIVPGTKLKKASDEDEGTYGFTADVEWPDDDMVAFASGEDDSDSPFSARRFMAERKFSLLTPTQLETIKQIIRDYHAAFAVGVFGPDSIPPDEVRRLIDTGILPQDLAFVFQPGPGERPPDAMRVTDLAYQYGANLGNPRQRPAVIDMGIDKFREHLDRTRLELSPVERQAMAFARYNAGEHVRGMGDRLATSTATTIRDADAEQRRRYMGTIRRELEANIDKRQTWRKLASEIGHATQDWSRDMQRLAATEKQFAMQEGTARAMAKGRDPGDIRVAKIPTPDACFVAGTTVETQSGPKPIEALQVGELVLTHRLRWRRVAARHVRQYDGMLVGINGVLPYATGNHPFLVDGGWKRADAIERGDHVVDFLCAADSDRDPAIGAQDSFFPRIALSGRALAAMPASAVEFYRYLQRRNSDVDVEHPDGQFEYDGMPAGYEQQSQGSRVFGYTALPMLACSCLLALYCWPRRLLTGLAREFCELLAFLWSAARGFFGADLRPGLEGHACFVQARPDGVLGDPVFPSSIGKCAAGSQVVRGERFDRDGRFGVGHGAGFAIPRRVAATTSVRFRGLVYNLTVEEDESYFANGKAVHNCPDCVRLHLTAGRGSAPRIFNLSDLQENGTNVGKKRGDWKAGVGPVHPWCFPPGTLIRMVGIDKRIEDIAVGDLVVTHANRLRAVQRLSERVFVGDLVVLAVGDELLKLTPGHPLLTPRGWVRADAIQVGDDLFQIHEALATHAEAEDGPSEHREERFLSRILCALAGAGVPVGVDLHDDAEAGEPDVRVVGADREFWHTFVSHFAEPLQSAALVSTRARILLASLRCLDLLPGRARLSTYSGVSCLREALSLFRAATIGYDAALLADGSDFDASTNEPGSDSAPAGTKAIRQLFDAIASFVGSDDFLNGELQSLGHDVAYHAAAVTSIVRARYEGPVFNFSVEEDESYTANGYVTHNCGCELVEVPDGWGFDDEGDLVPEIMLKKGDRLQVSWYALSKAQEERQKPHMTHGKFVPVDSLVVRVADPQKRQVIEAVLKEAPPEIFHKDIGITLITTDTPRAQNPLEDHDFAYWTGNEIRINQTLPIERLPRVLRHEIGHTLNVYLMRKLGGAEEVRRWHDRLWAISREEGWVSDYARKLPIENAAEVTRMYLFEKPRLLLNYPRQFAFVHRSYRPIFEKK